MAQVKVVTEDEVREEFNRIAHVDSPTPDKRQRAAQAVLTQADDARTHWSRC
jgi:hypothetical protein